MTSIETEYHEILEFFVRTKISIICFAIPSYEHSGQESRVSVDFEETIESTDPCRVTAIPFQSGSSANDDPIICRSLRTAKRWEQT